MKKIQVEYLRQAVRVAIKTRKRVADVMFEGPFREPCRQFPYDVVSYYRCLEYYAWVLIHGGVYDRDGYNYFGYREYGTHRDGFNSRGFNLEGVDRNGDRPEYDIFGYNQHGLNRSGRDRNGYDRHGYNNEGVDRNGKAAFEISVDEILKL